MLLVDRELRFVRFQGARWDQVAVAGVIASIRQAVVENHVAIISGGYAGSGAKGCGNDPAKGEECEDVFHGWAERKIADGAGRVGVRFAGRSVSALIGYSETRRLVPDVEEDLARLEDALAL